MDRIYKTIRYVKKHDLYPPMPIVQSPHEPEVVVDGKKVILFASNNYLGMLNDKRVIKAAEKGLKKWGIGNGSARLLTGNLDIHMELEKEIASFKGREAALTFVSGYMANEGCIPPIVNVLDPKIITSLIKRKMNEPDTIVFSDQYNHASIIAGIKMSGAKKEIYLHKDMNDLEKKLSQYKKNKRKLIVTDGVFSMEGDIANLPEIKKLADKYNAMIYLDDAHATGILGKHGRGTEDYYNMEGACDFVMGTFTKGFGGVGGYIVSNKEAIDYLKVTAPSFIFTAPIAPPVVTGLIESIKIVREEKWRREYLLENAEYLRRGLNSLGFDTMGSQTQIIPVLIGKEEKAQKFNELLFEKGFFVPISRWPAVPKGQARLRFAVMATHTKEQIDKLLKTMSDIKGDLNL
jgi:8-amino-7-oxononanoate synthase